MEIVKAIKRFIGPYKPIILGSKVTMLMHTGPMSRVNQDYRHIVHCMQVETKGKYKFRKIDINKKIFSVDKAIFDNSIFKKTEFGFIFDKHKDYSIHAKNMSVYLELRHTPSTNENKIQYQRFRYVGIKYTGLTKYSSFLGNTIGVPSVRDNKILIPDIDEEKKLEFLFKKSSKSLYTGFSTSNLIEILKNFNVRCVYKGKSRYRLVQYINMEKLLDHEYITILNRLITKSKFAKDYILIDDDNDILIVSKQEFQNFLSEVMDIVLGKEIKAFKEHRKQAQSVQKIVDLSVIDKLNINATLFDHQKIGVSWLYNLYQKKVPGAILADDMGMGKTIQAIALIDLIKPKTTVIVCPASVISVWEKEIKSFAPHLSNKVQIYSFEKFNNTSTTDVDFLIVDEAQRAKNRNTGTNKRLMLVNAKFTLLLSGTPIENKVEDLYNILRIVDPAFGKIFNYMKKTTNDEEFLAGETRKIIDSIYLRRVKTKNELSSTLTINNVYVDMTKMEANIHEAITKYYGNLLVKKSATNDLSYYSDAIIALMRLRQAVSFPYQLKKLTSEIDTLKNQKIDTSSSKVKEVLRLSANSKEKWIIFTSFTATLNHLKKVLPGDVLTISGETPSGRRGAIIKEFQEGSAKYIVVNIKAGNSGITLHAANNVIMYDLWWNPAVMQQAIARAYRIGQTKDVNVYMLVAKHSIDENILRISDLKQEIISTFETGSSPKGKDKSITNELIDSIFK